MLFSIHTGFVEAYKRGQADMIYLASSEHQAIKGQRLQKQAEPA
jgi:hypothetical protein